MSGNLAALCTVFTRPDSNCSGDNEAWLSIPWELLTVIGDQRFAEFIRSEPRSERGGLLQYIVRLVVPGFNESSNRTTAHGLLLARTYPQTFTLYSRYWSATL